MGEAEKGAPVDPRNKPPGPKRQTENPRKTNTWIRKYHQGKAPQCIKGSKREPVAGSYITITVRRHGTHSGITKEALKYKIKQEATKTKAETAAHNL